MTQHSNEMYRQANEKQLTARTKIRELFKATPMPLEQLLVNLPMYMRSSCLAKVLYLNELYELIVRTPGVIMEFGVWWGSNLVMFENLRAIHEPYNYTRKIVGFDTFEGYKNIDKCDGNNKYVYDGSHSVADEYTKYLSEIMDYHQSENVMSNMKKYELVKGDATVTINRYLEKHPETIISLAYFDMQLYKPTKSCLESIIPHLTKGSIIAMDEINSEEFPGETIAFKEIIGVNNCKLIRSKFLHDRAYMVFGQ